MHKIPVTLCLLWLGCSLSAQSLKTVEVADAYKDRDRINLSSFAESIEYIQLETSEETLLSYPNLRGIQGDSIMMITSVNRISLFSRNTGTFLGDIGHKGIDPDGFFGIASGLSFNTLNGNVFARKNTFELLEYDINKNKVVKTIPGPNFLSNENLALKESKIGIVSSLSQFHWTPEGFIAGPFQNFSGSENKKLVVYNTQGEVLKLFKNNRTFKKGDRGQIRSYSTDLFNFKKKSYFKEWFSDTLYSFNAQRITPEFYFDTEKYSPPYEQQDLLTDEKRSDLMFIQAITEDDKNLYFHLIYKNQWRVGLFNKTTNQTFISEPESDELNGFYNDLDSFVPFIPKFRTQEGYLVGTISAEDVYTWFQENRSRANKLPDHLKKFRNIDPEDNPIVMIVKPRGAN